MFRRRTPERQEKTVEDAPDSIAPWQMLEEEEIAAETAALRARLPDLHLTAFARHERTGERAAFDKGPTGTGKAVVVVGEAGVTRRYPGFGPWFDAALAERRG